MQGAAISGRIQNAAIPALALAAAVSSTLLALAYYVDAARAHHDVVTVYMDDEELKHVLANLFPAGAARRDIEYYLSNTPIWHGGYDPEAREIRGVIQSPQRLLLVRRPPPVDLVLRFDGDEKLTSVSYQRQGPF